MSNNDDDKSCFMDDRSNVSGFDLSDSQYDDIFELHQQLHHEGEQFDTIKANFERFMETEDGQRAKQRAENIRVMAQMTFMLELMGLAQQREELGEQEFWRRSAEQLRRADPFLKESTVGAVGQLYDDLLHKATAPTAALALVVGEEQAHLLTRDAFVAILRPLQHLQAMMASLLRENMQRVVDGCPDWDPETQTFVAGSGLTDLASIDLTTGLTRSETVAVSTEEQQAAEDALLSRLLGGLNL